MARLYGEPAAAALADAHVVVVGIGGVGSWAAEALARSGVGHLTLIDMDHVAESNINRQVHALESTLGAAKVELMAARIRDISPQARVTLVDDFVAPDNVQALVPVDATVVVDAIDAPRAKAALIAACLARGQPVVVCGAAGGRLDPLALQRADLADVRGDALLSAVRARLRRDHGFTREAGVRFGVITIHSPAPARARVGAADDCALPGQAPATAMPATDDASRGRGGAPLSCAGYGSIVTVTASMGMAAAGEAIAAIVGRGATRPRSA